MILGIVAIFAGLYLAIKSLWEHKTAASIDAELVGFQDERGASYPVFKFTYNGEEKTISGSVPVKNPSKYKHSVGDLVKVYYKPGNDKYVGVVGDFTELIYSAISLIAGIILVIGSRR